jgi:hypothetical protein
VSAGFQIRVERGGELIQIERLAQDLTGHDDDRKLIIADPNGVDQLHPITIRHAQVGHDHVGGVTRMQGQGAAPAACRAGAHGRALEKTRNLFGRMLEYDVVCFRDAL